jgi:anthranilate synthase component I
MFRPSLSQAQELSKNYAHVPVSLEIFADTDTTIGLLAKLEKRADCCFLLESVEGGEKWGRYSFLGFGPATTITARGGEATVTNRDGEVQKLSDPIGALRKLLAGGAPQLDYLPRFTGGVVGYFSYDCVRYFEDIPDENPDDAGFPDFCVMVADRLIVYDNMRQKLILIANMETQGDTAQNYNKACETLNEMRLEIRKSKEALNDKHTQPARKPEWKSNMTKSEFEQMVVKAKEHIVDGDIFQVVLSQRFESKMSDSLFNTYRVLRTTNPSPYMYYLKFGSKEIAGASPETLLRLEKGTLETCPIAGSRPRGKSKEEDEKFEKELLLDEKELSEHNMLVDLARNDLGRVSSFGSVEIKEYKNIVRYSHIMHMTSLVTSNLSKELDALDALGSVMPAGTLSGAPKVMAMKLIDQYENRRRGPYGGAVGYIGFDGNMDVCITIRTIVKNGDTAYVQSGAGIVADSVPETEYYESCNKAKAAMLAAELAAEMIDGEIS